MTKKGRIPKFKSHKKEAALGDTHDTTDYKDGFKPVNVKFGESLSVEDQQEPKQNINRTLSQPSFLVTTSSPITDILVIGVVSMSNS